MLLNNNKYSPGGLVPPPTKDLHRPRTSQEIKTLLNEKGLIPRHRVSNWCWVYKSIIDKYGKDIGPYGLSIYLVLARFCDESTTLVSYDKIAQVLGIERKTVIVYVKKLNELGLIVKDTKKYSKGHYATNTYYLTGGRTRKKQATGVNDK